jgi:hypothetical protein
MFVQSSALSVLGDGFIDVAFSGSFYTDQLLVQAGKAYHISSVKVKYSDKAWENAVPPEKAA